MKTVHPLSPSIPAADCRYDVPIPSRRPTPMPLRFGGTPRCLLVPGMSLVSAATAQELGEGRRGLTTHRTIRGTSTGRTANARTLPFLPLAMLVCLLGILGGRSPAQNHVQFREVAEITASDAAVDDNFAGMAAVAMSGDTLVVGASLDDDAGDRSGSAYVFVRNGVTWSEQAKLTASDAAAGVHFGISVAVSGNTALVGAPGTGAAGSDKAYVFVRTGTVWSEQAILTSGEAFGAFGHRVALEDDTALIGASTDDEKGPLAGAAYVFTRSGSTWTRQAKLTADDGMERDRLGLSVALDGDTALVGAYQDDTAATNAGAVYVFVRSGTTWSQQAQLTASDAATSDHMGLSLVALDGDTALVGARGRDTILGNNQGVAYVFVRSGSTWTQEAMLTAADPQAGQQFGQHVLLDGDTAIIGAQGDDGAATNAGAVYVFERDGSTWAQQDKLQAGDAAADDRFGTGLAMSDDNLVVGAPGVPGLTGPGTHTGSVYVFIRDDDADGLADALEGLSGTDPNDPDTDGDGLYDGTEVDIAQGSGCPDPLDPDSDDDTLLDGAEVSLGTSPCDADTDGDGIPDASDNDPLVPLNGSGEIEAVIRILGDTVAAFDPSVVSAPNANAAMGRLNALSNQLQAAANLLAQGNANAAVIMLSDVLSRMDGDPSPSDWLLPSPELELTLSTLQALIALLSP